MRAGLLRDIISIRSPASTSRSTDGAPIVTQSTVLKDIWARVDNKAGTEIYRDRNRWDVEEADFFIRYTTVSITPTMTVRYNSADYDIKAIIDLDNRHRELQIITKKVS